MDGHDHGPAQGPRLMESARLRRYLEIHAPLRHSLRDEAPSAAAGTTLTFSRTRRIDIRWDELAPGLHLLPSEADLLRRRIEEYWGYERGVSPDLAHWLHTTETDGELEAWTERLPTPLPAGAVILRHGTNLRFFRAIPSAGEVLDFANQYEEAWQVVESLQEVFAPRWHPGKEPLELDTLLSFAPTPPDLVPEALWVPESLRLRSLGRWPELSPPGPWDDPLLPGRSGVVLGPDWPVPVSGIYTPERLRPQLEASWGFLPPREVLEQMLARAAKDQFWTLPEEGFDPPTGKDWPLPFDHEQKVMQPVPADEWIVRWGDRQYWLKAEPGKTLADLHDPAEYGAAWRTQVGELQLVAEDRAKPPFTLVEEVDLQPALLVDQYRELDAEKRLAGALDTLATRVAKGLGEAELPESEEVQRLSGRYRELARPLIEVTGLIERLRGRAQRLGYVLATGDTAKDGKEKLEPGGLYRRQVRFATVLVRVRTSRSAWKIRPFAFGLHRKIRRVRRSGWRLRRVRRVQVDYIPVPVDREPWVQRREKYEEAGFRAFVLDLAENGYVAQDGQPLAEIMARCEADEAFRRETVLFLPVYEESLTQGMVKVRYEVLVRPLPGTSIVSEPGLYLEEDLAYRTEWRGTELGELIHSFNLAPGETRNVTVTREITRQTEVVDSITSLLDVVQERSADYSTELEKTVRSERETRNESNWNVKASVSFFDIASVGGGGGGSHSQTSRQFSQTIHRAAVKTSQKMRRQEKVEVKSSTTTQTRVHTAESTTSTLKNINEGRTLNLFFYRLDNVFLGALFLEGIRFVHVPTREIVAGTGIRDPHTYPLDELPLLLDDMVADPGLLPWLGVQPEQLQLHVLRRLSATILGDHVALGGEGGAAGDGADTDTDSDHAADGADADKAARYLLQAQQRLDLSTGALTFADPPRPEDLRCALGFPERPDGDDAAGDSLDERYAREMRSILNVLLRLRARPPVPIEPHFLSIPSGGTYLDALVGEGPATEGYSEDMRRHELAIREAEGAARRAEAGLIAARAAHLRGHDDADWRVVREPTITEVSRGDGNRWTLALSSPLPEGDWLAEVAGEPVDLAAGGPGASEVSFVLALSEAGASPVLLRERHRHLVVERRP